MIVAGFFGFFPLFLALVFRAPLHLVLFLREARNRDVTVGWIRIVEYFNTYI
jgi:hypothetical protein